MQVDAKALVEAAAGLAILISAAGLSASRLLLKRGFGARSVQFVIGSALLPVVLILSLERIVSGEAAIALIAGAAGYTLSGIFRFDERRGDD